MGANLGAYFGQWRNDMHNATIAIVKSKKIPWFKNNFPGEFHVRCVCLGYGEYTCTSSKSCKLERKVYKENITTLPRCTQGYGKGQKNGCC